MVASHAAMKVERNEGEGGGMKEKGRRRKEKGGCRRSGRMVVGAPPLGSWPQATSVEMRPLAKSGEMHTRAWFSFRQCFLATREVAGA